MKDIDQFLEILNEQGDEIVNEAMSSPTEEKIYDKWTGVVIENDDSKMFSSRLGRIQVKINGYYDDISDVNIPWAMPEIGFFGSTNGNFIVPEIGSVVRGYFEKGDIMKPVYDSIAPSYDHLNKTKSSIKYSLDYPHIMTLLETDNGEILTLNRKTGVLNFVHRTGSQFTIDKDGNIKIVANSNTNVVGTDLLDKPSSLTVETEGNINLVSHGNVNITAAKQVNIKTDTEIGEINLGNNPMKTLVNNLPICPVLGCKLAVGNTQVKC